VNDTITGIIFYGIQRYLQIRLSAGMSHLNTVNSAEYRRDVETKRSSATGKSRWFFAFAGAYNGKAGESSGVSEKGKADYRQK
jgi:hypothetical protein